jgi:plastocyanin
MMTEFTDALYKQNAVKMESVVEKYKVQMPGKINELLEVAVKPGLSKEEREERLYILERLATIYKDVTGDFSPLKGVKKRSFESRLSPAVVSRQAFGVHIVETVSTETLKNMFRPDNIIIKKGDTIRWVNNDTTIHLLASVLTSIGEGGMFSPRVEPGQSWEHTFNSPGEYYYICFIHKIMYGKILVKR